MSNSIKFRSWNVEEKIMHDIAFPSWNGSHEVWENNEPQSKIQYLSNGPADEGILMLYTGVEDKNGKEICVGDIIRAGNSQIIDIQFGKWQFSDDKDSYYGIGFSFGGCEPFGEGADKSSYEILGNIFQNPELLQQ